MRRTVGELLRLDGRRALVTGGAGHIGEAIAEALVELGAAVAITDRDASALAARRDTLARDGGRVVAVAGDLRREASTRAVARRAIAALGGLDVLVHAAGYVGTTDAPGWAVPFARQTVAAWDQALRVNLTAAFILAQEAHAALARGGRGSVVLIGSIYATVSPTPTMYVGTPMVSPAGYSASKGGLAQLTRWLATTLAPRVRVNMLSPGGIARQQPAVFKRRYAARTPLGRLGVEEDVKGAVAYLAGDASAYVTGQSLIVDGGWTVC